MSKYKFTNEQRYAIWHTYGHKCYWCNQPLPFQEVTIDHILPESLLDNPEQLERVKHEYGLDTEFSINDYCNWVPAHSHCNRSKGIRIYPASPAVLAILECARNKANEARIEAERANNDVKRGNLLAKVKIALDEGVLSKDEVAETVKYVDLEEGQQLLVRGDWSVISIDKYDVALVTDGRSFGRTPVKNHDISWMCPGCRSYGPWRGNMCLSCGMKCC